MQGIGIGVSDFKALRLKDCYFIDKSLFIKHIIDNSSKVTLITRPRRFGKTLNMSMLRYYLDCRKKYTDELFDGLKIMEQGEFYTSKQKAYPVIYMTFKDVRGRNFENMMLMFQTQLHELFIEYIDLLQSEKLISDWGVDAESEQAQALRALLSNPQMAGRILTLVNKEEKQQYNLTQAIEAQSRKSLEYEEKERICGNRNSYFKTDEEKQELERVIQKLTGVDISYVENKITESRSVELEIFETQMRREFARVNNVSLSEVGHVYVDGEMIDLDDTRVKDMGFYTEFYGEPIRIEMNNNDELDMYDLYKPNKNIEESKKELLKGIKIIKKYMQKGIKGSNELTDKELEELKGKSI